MALEIRDLSIRHGTRLLVSDISFSLGESGVTVLIGPSGCGKSSVLKYLAGILDPDLEVSGTLLHQGQRLQPPHGLIGYQPQSDALFPWLTLLENAALGLEVAGCERRAARARALAQFPAFGLGGADALLPDQVSGGMRQRVAFLRTMLRETPYVLLDEPFSALDAVTRLRMQAWLAARLAERPRGVLLVSHDLHEASLLADRVLVMGGKAGTFLADLIPDQPPHQRSEAMMAPLREKLKSLLLKEDLP